MTIVITSCWQKGHTTIHGFGPNINGSIVVYTNIIPEEFLLHHYVHWVCQSCILHGLKDPVFVIISVSANNGITRRNDRNILTLKLKEVTK